MRTRMRVRMMMRMSKAVLRNVFKSGWSMIMKLNIRTCKNGGYTDTSLALNHLCRSKFTHP